MSAFVFIHWHLFGRGFGVDAGIKIFGWGSRRNPQKSFSIMLRDRYGTPSLNYPLFPELPITEFKAFVLRAGASEATSGGTFFRDPFAWSLIADKNLDFQAFRPAIIFINGEYWGIQNIREKSDPASWRSSLTPYGTPGRQNDTGPEQPRLILSETRLNSDGFFEFILTATPGQRYLIQRSTDLSNWIDFTTVEIEKIPAVIRTNPNDSELSFYRAMESN